MRAVWVALIVAGWFVGPGIVAPWAEARESARYNLAVLGSDPLLDIRNLADKAYVSNVQAQIRANPDSAAYWPGDGRSLFGGLKWSY